MEDVVKLLVYVKKDIAVINTDGVVRVVNIVKLKKDVIQIMVDVILTKKEEKNDFITKTRTTRKKYFNQ